MTSKALVCIALSTICGMIASIGLSQWMEKTPAKVAAKASMERIFVAQAAIEPGTLLTHENLRLAAWETDVIPSGAIRQIDEVLGKVATTPLRPGDAVETTTITTPAEYALRRRPLETHHESDAHVESSPPLGHAPVAVAPPAADSSPTLSQAAEAAPTPAAAPAASLVENPPVVVAHTELVAATAAPKESVEVQEPTPPRPAVVRRSADRPVATVTEARTDDGWVKTYNRGGGSKVLRWRPDSDAPATEAAGKSSGGRGSSAVEHTARPTADPRKS